MNMLQQQYEIFPILRLENGYYTVYNTTLCSDDKLEDVTERALIELKKHTLICICT